MKFYTNALQNQHIPNSDVEISNRLKDIIPFLTNLGQLTSVNTYTYQYLLDNLPKEDNLYISTMINNITNQTKISCKRCAMYNIFNEVPFGNVRCQSEHRTTRTYLFYNDIMNETSLHTNTSYILKNMLSCISTSLYDNVKEQHLINDVMLVTRPPGHHSSDDVVSGFCYINWTYIISQYLRNLKEDNKVCIVDLDLHHGNGTEIMVKNKPNTLFMDFHYYDGGFYPGTGNEFEFVADNIINVNMPKKSKDDAYLDRFIKELPKLKNFNPDLFIMSMGCDIVDGDNFKIMKCSHLLYKKIYDILKAEFGKNIVIVLEGGYNTNNVTNSIKEFVS